MNWLSTNPLTLDPVQLVLILTFFSVAPLFFVMSTPFLKISMVLLLLRNALGIQQIPPNMALYALSLVLSVFIMAPIYQEVNEQWYQQKIQTKSLQSFEQVDQMACLEPYKKFLKRHSLYEQIKFFKSINKKVWKEKYNLLLSENSFLVLLPAFAVSQIIEAFKIGLLLYLPFIAIDLIVSNVLLAMGMMMVSPMTIALPFKLLVFVLIGGWQRLFEQLVLSFK